MNRLKLLTRIALFSSLIYIFSWISSYIPNVNLIFFIVFTTGFLWGFQAGFVTGAIGMALWSVFNPMGMPNPLTLIAQIVGAGAGAVSGAMLRKIEWKKLNIVMLLLYLEIAAIVSTLVFYIPINLVDAWLYQPFWERFVGGMMFSMISFGSNMIIFPILFPLSRQLYYLENQNE